MNTNPEPITKETPVNPAAKDDEAVLHVIYGSRTGNSMAAATLAWEYANHLGVKSHLHDMKTLVPEDVAGMKNILLAVSTHGEGDPPAVVENFYFFMNSEQAPDMSGTRFSVLALGDSSYNDYCKTGHDFRNRFLELGAAEVSPLIECDIDYEENAKQWVQDAVSVFENLLPKVPLKKKGEFAFEINKTGQEEGMYYARVKSMELLTSPDFPKRTMHLVLSSEKFSSPYQPGDSFRVSVQNSRLLVDKILKALKFDGTHAVKSGKEYKLLKEALINDYEITVLTPVVVEKYAAFNRIKTLSGFIKNKAKLNRYCTVCDVLDLITDFPSPISPEEFVSILRKLNPRLYSVANSPLAFPDEVHFTVGLMEYDIKNRRHTGVCSTLFADRLEAGDNLPVQLEVNEKFRIPENNATPIIMIATGTGIAPFRGFLQYREQVNANGLNWLIFGDRHKASDFLYQDEIEGFLKKGLLTKLSTAFSRDQKDKIYVHHLMIEQGEEIFRWIEEKKAVVYICGNKRTMGKSVRLALEEIISTYGKMSKKSAVEYIETMRMKNRLQTDIY